MQQITEHRLKQLRLLHLPRYEADGSLSHDALCGISASNLKFPYGPDTYGCKRDEVCRECRLVNVFAPRFGAERLKIRWLA